MSAREFHSRLRFKSVENARAISETGKMLTGQVSRILVQAAYFVLAARLLGVEQFGILSAILAVATIVSPFASLGSNSVMARDIARNHDSARSAWQRNLLLLTVGGLLASLVGALAALIVNGWGAALVILLLGASEIVCARLVESVGFAWQALGVSRPMVVLPTLLNLFRLAATLGLLLWSSSVDLLVWSLALLASSLPLAVIAASLTSSRLRGRSSSRLTVTGTPRWTPTIDGLGFALGISAQSAYAEVGKVSAATLAGPADGGIFAASARVIEMAYAPVRAIAAVTYPRYFRAGQSGLRAALRVSGQAAPMAVLYSVLAALLVWIAAPFVPVVLGDEFEGVVALLQILAPVLVARTATYLAADALSGADLQGARSVAQVIVTIGAMGLAVGLTVAFGVIGTVSAQLISELILAAVMWLLVSFELRKSAALDGSKEPHG